MIRSQKETIVLEALFEAVTNAHRTGMDSTGWQRVDSQCSIHSSSSCYSQVSESLNSILRVLLSLIPIMLLILFPNMLLILFPIMHHASILLNIAE